METLQRIARLHGAGELGPEGGQGVAKQRGGLPPHGFIDALGGGVAQPPEQAAELVAGGVPFHRPLPTLKTEMKATVGITQADNRPQVAAGELRGAGIRLGGMDPQHRHQGAGRVLDAEAFTQGQPAPGELADPAHVGEGREVIETRGGRELRRRDPRDGQRQQGEEDASPHFARRSSSTLACSFATCSSASPNGVGATTLSRE